MLDLPNHVFITFFSVFLASVDQKRPIMSVIYYGLGYAVAQLVEALHYKPEGRGFDSRWSHWNFSVT